jgi:hypothetical protein
VALKPARLSTRQEDGQEITYVEIEETGAFWIPDTTLSGVVFRGAQDVVRISFGLDSGQLVLEALGGVVTTEPLSANVRLRILPKVGFRGLVLLLQWATGAASFVGRECVPAQWENDVGVYELFAAQLLRALRPIAQLGWLPRVRRSTVISHEVRGDVDLLKSYEATYSRGALSLVQDVQRLTFAAPANRAIKTALLCLNSSRRLSEDYLVATREALASIPYDVSADPVTTALESCERLLSTRGIEPARSYFYPAIEWAIPVLEATSRGFDGQHGIRDTPMRVKMPECFEAAVRNFTAHRLAPRFHASKETGIQLYTAASPESFDTPLEPDIVIRPVGRGDVCLAVIDVKYKLAPTSGDHQQLTSYMAALDATLGAFVVISDSATDSGPRGKAETKHGGLVIEYVICAGDIAGSLRAYGAWLDRLSLHLAAMPTSGSWSTSRDALSSHS